MNRPNSPLRPGPSVGDQLGPYHLEALLGEGGAGVVFRARQEPGGTLVALKILKDELAQSDLYRRRFLHEVRVAREITHRHLVPIIDAGDIDGRQFIAARYLAGGSLADHLKDRGVLARDELLRLVTHVASGLDALHEHGIIHRDIKPANILLDGDGSAALTDFGLAKGAAYTVLTRPGNVLGTLHYLAPELIRGQSATPATDIYALGCVVFECMAGHPPFGGRGVFQIGFGHLEEDPADPRTGRSDLPASLGRAALTALAKDPAKRPPKAMAYATFLRMAAGPVPT